MPEEHSFPSLENAVLPRQNEDDSGLYQLRKGAWVPRSFTLSTNAKRREWKDHKVRGEEETIVSKVRTGPD